MELPRSVGPSQVTKYVLVIDTNSDRIGDFYHDFVGFAAGCWGDEGGIFPAGYLTARLFHQQESAGGYDGMEAMTCGPLANLFEQRPDKEGKFWPCEMYPTTKLFSKYGSDGRSVVREQEKPDDEYKHPVHRSVAIFCSVEPTDSQCRLIARRAVKYSKNPVSGRKAISHTPFTVIGIRLLTEAMMTVEVDNWIVPTGE